MYIPYTIDDVIRRLGPRPTLTPSPAPTYAGVGRKGMMLAVESMREHMTDEGWQIALGLQHGGYTLMGRNCAINGTDVGRTLGPIPSVGHRTPAPIGAGEAHTIAIPAAMDLLSLRERIGVVVVQDKREWDVQPGNFRDPLAGFKGLSRLRDDPTLFKLTVVKDAQHNIRYHQESADEIGCHAWIIYYHPRIVGHLAPYVRGGHMVRTYHSLDQRLVPTYSPDNRFGALLSGAVSGAYPLRLRMRQSLSLLAKAGSDVTHLPHPGYHRRGSATPSFLKTLSRYKVAVCTASIYGYALRKMIEATACGCVVLTDLPEDEVLPEIDANIVRIHPDTPIEDIAGLIRDLCESYDPPRQADFAGRARLWYDLHAVGDRLVSDIETMRSTYHAEQPR